MERNQKTAYVVTVKGKPGHGTRTFDKTHAENCKASLEKQYTKVKIVERKAS